MVDLSVKVGSLRLKNPVMCASGTFGYGLEYSEMIDLNRLGGIVVKGLSLKPHQGNPPPRLAETPAGMLNSIGLQNIGLAAFVREKLPRLRDYDTTVVVNIWGETIDDYCRLAEGLSRAGGVGAVELNVSCPNKGGRVMCIGQSPELTGELTEAVVAAGDLPVWVKLTPNVTDHLPVAQAAQEAGAEAVCLINTLLGLAIDARSGRPRLGGVLGGLSGPAIKPVALRMVWQAAGAIAIPIIGLGGIMTGEDAAEFIVAGATAVQVGTANLVDPQASINILEGLAAFLEEQGLGSPRELRGRLDTESG